jgi:hypothetical protein
MSSDEEHEHFEPIPVLTKPKSTLLDLPGVFRVSGSPFKTGPIHYGPGLTHPRKGGTQEATLNDQ